MREEVFYEIIRKLKTRPDLRRKLKIFLVIGFIGVCFAGTMVVWAGVSAFRYLTSISAEIVKSPTAVAELENLGNKVERLPHLQPLSCWGKAESLIAVEPWLTATVVENLRGLTVACFGNLPAKCSGSVCKDREASNSPKDTAAD